MRDECVDSFGAVLVQSSDRQGQRSSGVNHIVNENCHLNIENRLYGRGPIEWSKRAISYLASHVANQQLHLFRRFAAADAPLPVDERKIKLQLVRDGSDPGYEK